MFKDNWDGTGSMDEFVREANRLFKMMNNIKVIVPSDYSGTEPTLRFEGGKMIFEMNDALIFNYENLISYRTAGFEWFSLASVYQGRLTIISDVRTP